MSLLQPGIVGSDIKQLAREQKKNNTIGRTKSYIHVRCTRIVRSGVMIPAKERIPCGCRVSGAAGGVPPAYRLILFSSGSPPDGSRSSDDVMGCFHFIIFVGRVPSSRFWDGMASSRGSFPLRFNNDLIQIKSMVCLILEKAKR